MNLQTGCNEYLPPGIDFVEIGKYITKFNSTFRGEFYYKKKKSNITILVILCL